MTKDNRLESQDVTFLLSPENKEWVDYPWWFFVGLVYLTFGLLFYLLLG